jgi:hypothetical protein
MFRIFFAAPDRAMAGKDQSLQAVAYVHDRNGLSVSATEWFPNH